MKDGLELVLVNLTLNSFKVLMHNYTDHGQVNYLGFKPQICNPSGDKKLSGDMHLMASGMAAFHPVLASVRTAVEKRLKVRL